MTKIAFCFDRFFTSVNLIDTLPLPAVGICISTRKNVPKFPKKKRTREEITSVCNDIGTLACLWMDTKEVVIIHRLKQIASRKTAVKLISHALKL